MTLPRLPLPGEHPSSIWRPKARKSTPRSSVSWRLVGVVVGLALAGLGWLVWQATATPVTVVANGETLSIRTHHSDVDGALTAAGVESDRVVYLDPSGDTPLQPGMVITVGYQRPVVVLVDGKFLKADTRLTSPDAILAEMGIVVNPGDSVQLVRSDRPSAAAIRDNPALAGVVALPREIHVVRARTVIVNQAGSLVSFTTGAETVGEALSGAGYQIFAGDVIDPPLDTQIPPEGIEVSYRPGTPLTIQVDGRQIPVRTQGTTVREALSEIGLAANPPDYTLPQVDSPIVAGGVIRLVRVTEDTEIEDSPIDADILYVPDVDLELDQQRELEAGTPGVLSRQTLVRREDGTVVSRIVLGEWTTRQPQPRIVAYGTRIVIRDEMVDGASIRYWRKLHVLATSYSPSTAGDKQPGDARFGISGTGAVLKRGVIAVDPRVIALGTWMVVPGYGPGRALDTGGAIKGMRIDLGFEDPLPQLWNNWVDIYLVLPIPPPDEIRWVLP